MRDGNVDDQPTGRLAGLWRRLVQHPLEKLGPGLITGVADDDPSGIATYSQAGAQFGLDMLWTLPLTYPLMAAVQSMCARLGRVTGKGLAANIKAHFPPWVLWSVVVLLVIADTLNIGADVAAMGESAQLVLGLDSRILTVAFALLTLSLQLLVPYHRYVVFLKWLTLALLAYGVVLFTVRVPWGAVVAHTLYPRFKPTATAATTVIAVFGTTISPYLFFWQASEEVEDMEEAESPAGRQPLVEAPGARAPGIAAHPLGHLERHALFQRGRLLHRPGDRGDAAQRRHHRHRDRGPGRQRASSAGRRLRVGGLHPGHPRRRPDRRAGVGGGVGLCDR